MKKEFLCYSDCGGVQVGNKDFGFVISNGYGDGETEVRIYSSDEKFDSFELMFVTMLEGSFNIYCNDCCDRQSSNQIVATLNGRAEVWRGHGLVIFRKYEDGEVEDKFYDDEPKTTELSNKFEKFILNSKVKHPIFGKGKIIKVDKQSDYVYVNFGYCVKILDLKYAPLTIIEE